MAPTTTSPTRSSDDIFDTTPFLSSRPMMQEPSIPLQEIAAKHLEEALSNSKRGIIRNFAFVAVASAVLFFSRDESPSMPLRLWISGYTSHCIINMVYATVDYRRLRRQELTFPNVSLAQSEEEMATSLVKNLKFAIAQNTFTVIWFIIGVCWVCVGGRALARDSPQLFWLCIIFLAFDAVFVGLCVTIVVLLVTAVFAFFIAILHVMEDLSFCFLSLLRNVERHEDDI